MNHYYYLLIDFFTIIVPLIFSFHYKLKFFKYFKPFFIANIFVAIIFITWDIYFTKLGVWGFNPNYVMGYYFFNLPVEEILFFICIPFSCLFTYYSLNLFFKFHWKQKTENIIIIGIAIIFLIVGICFNNKFYPAFSFISLGILLLVFKYVAKVKWLAKIIYIYPVLLIPFFIVNGMLTGTGLQSHIVWYNNNENLGIRILTIPIEDVFYGFELIILNIFLFEYLKTKFDVNK